jgi:hypothetical protein
MILFRFALICRNFATMLLIAFVIEAKFAFTSLTIIEAIAAISVIVIVIAAVAIIVVKARTIFEFLLS